MLAVALRLIGDHLLKDTQRTDDLKAKEWTSLASERGTGSLRVIRKAYRSSFGRNALSGCRLS
jgi:hypothetical protein